MDNLVFRFWASTTCPSESSSTSSQVAIQPTMTIQTNDNQTYVTLDFSKMPTTSGSGNSNVDGKPAVLPVIPPPRHSLMKTEITKKSAPAINHHLHIHQPYYGPKPAAPKTGKTIRSHQDDPRDFATFLCIFATVMTTVLVLMFYMVGEAAFKLILLVISFVSVLTLCLACFLRRPTLIILGQTIHHQQPATTDSSQNSNMSPTAAPQPYMLIFPTLFGGEKEQHPAPNISHQPPR